MFFTSERSLFTASFDRTILDIFRSFLFANFALDNANAYMNWGWCPSMPTAVGNFDVSKYSGNWYEIKVDKDVWYEQNA